MESKRVGDTVIGRIDKGEKVFESIQAICRKHNVKLGKISGIGAVKDIKLGLYNPATKDYDIKVFKEDMELCSINGNVIFDEGDYKLHLHVTLSDTEYKVIGGHLYEAEIIATCELFIKKIKGSLTREHDAETNLNLISFSS